MPPITPHPLHRCHWWLPSFSQWLWLVVLLVLLTKPWRTIMVGADGDACMHWRVGEYMLEQHRIIRTDVFSHTRFGAPIISKEWLAELIFAAAGRWAGLYGLGVVAALIIATTFALLHRQLVRENGNLLVATLVAVLALWPSTAHWLARPHAFSFLMLVLWHDALRRYERERRPVSLALRLGAVTLLWVNLHGGYLAGFLVLGAYWLGALIERFQLITAPTAGGNDAPSPAANATNDGGLGAGLSPGGERPALRADNPASPLRGRGRPRVVSGTGEGESDPRLASFRPTALRAKLTVYTLVAGLCALVSLANPNGWHLHVHNLAFLRLRFFTGWLAEYASTNFQSAAATGFAVWLALLLFTLVVVRPRWSPAGAVLLLMWCYFALYAGRNIPLLAILTAPLVASALAERVRVSSNRWLVSARALSERLGGQDQGACGWPVVAALAIAAIAAVPRPTTMPSDKWPIQAVEFIRHNPAKFAGNLFNQYSWGGYLMQYLPEHQVFVDPRADFYGEGLVREFDTTTALRPDWKVALDKYHVRWTLMPTNHRLNLALAELADWEQAYSDPVATIYVRSGP